MGVWVACVEIEGYVTWICSIWFPVVFLGSSNRLDNFLRNTYPLSLKKCICIRLVSELAEWRIPVNKPSEAMHRCRGEGWWEPEGEAKGQRWRYWGGQPVVVVVVVGCGWTLWHILNVTDRCLHGDTRALENPGLEWVHKAGVGVHLIGSHYHRGFWGSGGETNTEAESLEWF